MGWARALLLVASLAPHAWFLAVGSVDPGTESFLLGVMAANLAPTLLTPLVDLFAGRVAGLGWLAGCALAGWYALFAAVLRPTDAQAALVYLFLPAWTILCVAPAGAGVAGLGAAAVRRRRR